VLPDSTSLHKLSCFLLLQALLLLLQALLLLLLLQALLRTCMSYGLPAFGHHSHPKTIVPPAAAAAGAAAQLNVVQPTCF
jgi:hypothetical protein